MLAIIGQSARVANTYLVDLGGGLGAVYHDDLRYIEDPRQLEALRGKDPRWQPWQPVGDGRRADELVAHVTEAIMATAAARRERFPSGTSVRDPQRAAPTWVRASAR